MKANERCVEILQMKQRWGRSGPQASEFGRIDSQWPGE